MNLDSVELISFLKENKKLYGELFPILIDNEDKIIDGEHRKKAGWENTRKLSEIDTRLKYLVARLSANTRRRIKPTELRDLLTQIADELVRTGKAPWREEEAAEPWESRGRPIVVPFIMKLTGYSESTVRKYLPNRYKRGSLPIKTPRERERYKGSETVNKYAKRSRLEIRGDMISVLKVANNFQLKPTQLMYKSNISYVALQDHLRFLEEKNLVEYTEPYYRLTDLGIKVQGLWRALLTYLLYLDDEMTVPMKMARNIFLKPVPEVTR